jgi:hypothetical protein
VEFPADRLRRAGASEQELEHLAEAFENSGPGAQETYCAELAKASDYELANRLARARGEIDVDEQLPDQPPAGGGDPDPKSKDPGPQTSDGDAEPAEELEPPAPAGK